MDDPSTTDTEWYSSPPNPCFSPPDPNREITPFVMDEDNECREYLEKHFYTSPEPDKTDDEIKYCAPHELLSHFNEEPDEYSQFYNRREAMAEFHIPTPHTFHPVTKLKISLQILDLACPNLISAFQASQADNNLPKILVPDFGLDAFTIYMHHLHHIYAPWQKHGFRVTEEHQTLSLLCIAWAGANTLGGQLVMKELMKRILDKVVNFELAEREGEGEREEEYVTFLNLLDQNVGSPGLEEIRTVVVNVKAGIARLEGVEGLCLDEYMAVKERALLRLVEEGDGDGSDDEDGCEILDGDEREEACDDACEDESEIFDDFEDRMETDQILQ